MRARITSALAGGFFLLLLAACGGGGGGGSAAPTGTGSSATQTVSGTVTLNGAALAGVQVSIPGQGTQQTNAEGRYAFTHVADGSYVVTPSLANYKFTPESTTVTVSGNAAVADFGAIRTSYAVYGRILAQNGSGLAGATVTVARGGIVAGTAVTDGTGCYSVGPLPAVPYDVTVTHPGGYAFPTRSVTVVDTGVTADFSAPVAATYSISGTVTFENGAPRANAPLTLNFGTSAGWSGAAVQVTTDGSGAYAFRGLTDNGLYGYRIMPELPAGYTVDASGVTSTLGGVQLSIDRDVTLNLVLHPPGPGSAGGSF